MLPVIDRSRCTSCGLCVRDCIYGVLGFEGRRVVVRDADSDNNAVCAACGHCVAVCPEDAIALPELGAPASTGALPSPEEVESLMRIRRSVRHYAPRPVPRAMIERLLAAAGQAPSGCNARPVEVTVVVDPELRDRIERHTAALTVPVARLMVLRPVQALLRRAPLAAIRRSVDPDTIIGLRMLVDGRADDRPWVTLGAPALLFFHGAPDRPTPAEDAAIAADHISLLAQSMGLGTCWNGVLVEAVSRLPHIRRRLGIPRGHRIFCAMALGWPAIRHVRAAPRRPLPARFV